MSVSAPLIIFLIKAAYMWAGGPDIPDAVYSWQVNDVSTADYEPHPTAALPLFQSRNSCDVNRLALPPPTVANVYTACLPVAR
jgi:hypothetical protein